jgi:hypothetical protein
VMGWGVGVWDFFLIVALPIENSNGTGNSIGSTNRLYYQI